MFQLSKPVRLLAKGETLEVFRYGRVTFVSGKPSETQKICFQATGNVQPMTGLELLMVPEGDRFKERYWFYVNEATQAIQISDRVVRLGVNFEVQKIETWGRGPVGYQKVMITRIDVGPDTSPVAAPS